jgi:hypothetical protein
MATVFKTIKPARLKEDAFRLYMLNAMRQSGKEIQAEYAKTTATWKTKPVFETLVSLSGAKFTVAVLTNDKIFDYVDRGTRPHEIWAGFYTGKSNKKVLAFKGSHYPKTFPGVLGSVPGGSFGKDVRVPYVHHPGNAPRKFTAAIEKLYQPKFKKNCEEAMRLFAQGSGMYAGRRR